MPHTDSAKKRVKQYAKRQALNKDKRSAMKTWMKKVAKAVADGDKVKARSELSIAKQKIDKAAQHRVIHPNTAARRKSLLDRKVGRM